MLDVNALKHSRFGAIYLEDIVSTENSTCVSSVSVLSNCALHLWAQNQHPSHTHTADAEQQTAERLHASYLFLHGLKLFIIHGQIDQHCALIGAVERQVWICTCETTKRCFKSNIQSNDIDTSVRLRDLVIVL